MPTSPSDPREQARAARLTAIAERLNQLEQLTGQSTTLGDVRFLLAHVETLTQQVAELRQYEMSHSAIIRTQAAYIESYKAQGEAALIRAEQAEQQRDAAHAALTALTAHCCCHEPQGWPFERPACVGAIARAALALRAD
jgi:hypothetical protein